MPQLELASLNVHFFLPFVYYSIMFFTQLILLGNFFFPNFFCVLKKQISSLKY